MPVNEAFIKRLAAKKQAILERLDAEHGKALDRALIALERKVVLMAMELPDRGGTMWTTRAAIEFRPSLEQAVRETYLGWARKTVDGYDKSAGEILAAFGKLDLPAELTDLDREIIGQLKQLHFEGFQDIALTTIKDLSDSVYQSALTGENPSIAIDRLRGTINGIYHEADTDEVQRLVDFVKENRDIPKMEEAVAKAVEELHTIHGATATGQNMRRYANQMVHDSLMQFDSQFTKHMAEQAGLDHYYYSGTSVRDSRPWCIAHIGRVMSEDEIRDEWSSQTWQGKAPGDPFTVRGGFSCRHSWIPVDPDWVD